jgi:hypothetical protein
VIEDERDRPHDTGAREHRRSGERGGVAERGRDEQHRDRDEPGDRILRQHAAGDADDADEHDRAEHRVREREPEPDLADREVRGDRRHQRVERCRRRAIEVRREHRVERIPARTADGAEHEDDERDPEHGPVDHLRRHSRRSRDPVLNALHHQPPSGRCRLAPRAPA